jgi:hypothetical protein
MAAIVGRDSRISSVLLVGDYGSGKTEIAVNLAFHLAAQQAGEAATTTGRRQVAIADLDLVNPYFRCREAAEPLAEAGIRVVVPPGGQRFADLPILLPQVRGLLQDPDALSILDVGGDDVGARVLSAIAPSFDPARHAFWFVLNTNRPFNDTVAGCVKTIRRIEASSTLRVTGIVPNTHLMDETTPEMIVDGLRVAERVSTELGVSIAFVAVMDQVAQRMADDAIRHPVLKMRRIMVPPWLRRDIPKTGPELVRSRPV